MDSPLLMLCPERHGAWPDGRARRLRKTGDFVLRSQQGAARHTPIPCQSVTATSHQRLFCLNGLLDKSFKRLIATNFTRSFG